MSHRTTQNNFSLQIKVGDSESVTGLVHQYHESTWNCGSCPKIMIHGKNVTSNKGNSFLAK